MKWNEDLYELADRVFGDRRDEDAAAPAGDTSLWRVVDELDWPLVAVEETSGGAGGELADLMEIVRAAGRRNALVPLVETSLAAWLVGRGGGRVADLGSATSIVVDDRLDWGCGSDGVVVGGPLPAVAWAGSTASLLLLRRVDETRTTVAVVRAEGATGVSVRRSGSNLAGEPWGELELAAVVVADADLLEVPVGLAEISDRAGILRAGAILGAVERAVEHAAEHVATRQQFGRPLVKLQAVQHLLASVICERDILAAAVHRAIASHGAPGHAAAASATAGRVANRVAAVTHQLHGAIGITEEHDLHLSTSRLLAWRDAPRSQRSWEQEVGELVVGADDEKLWDLMTGTSPAVAP